MDGAGLIRRGSGGGEQGFAGVVEIGESEEQAAALRQIHGEERCAAPSSLPTNGCVIRR